MSRGAAEGFARLADVVAEMRQDVAAALAKVAPNHMRDFAQLFTALTAIEQKPALAASSGDIKEAAKAGASEGSAAAVADLGKARQALAQAVEEIQAGERRRRQVSRRAKGAVVALLVLVPALVSFGTGLAVAPTLQREGWLPLTGISPAAPRRVNRTMAKALTSRRRSRRVGPEMRVAESPIPNRKSLVSRKLGSMLQRLA